MIGTMTIKEVYWILAITVIAVLAGILQVQVPFVGPGVILTIVILPIMLVAEREWLIIGTLAVLIASRALIIVGAPSLINHAWYAMLLILAGSIGLDIALGRSHLSKVANRIHVLMVALAVVVAFSGLINDWHALRPILLWILLSAPFLLFAATRELDDRGKRRVRIALLALLILQIPFAYVQFAIYGGSDPVQGTLVGQGAGAHIVGAICLIGAALLAIESRRKSNIRPLVIPISVFLLSVGVLSDAKQVYAAAILGFGVMFLPLLKSQFIPAIISAALVAGLSFIMIGFNSVFGRIFDFDFIATQLEIKMSFTSIALDYPDLTGLMVGYGPGNGTSKIALLATMPGFGHVPEMLVGREPAALTWKLLTTDMGLRPWELSSSNSPFFSILSILTDIGVFGFLIYVFLGVQVWTTTTNLDPFSRNIARSLILTALLLGIVYQWLEEPAFTVVLATAIGSMMPAESAPETIKRPDCSTGSRRDLDANSAHT